MADAPMPPAKWSAANRVSFIVNSILIGLFVMIMAPVITGLGMVMGSADIWNLGCFFFGPVYTLTLSLATLLNLDGESFLWVFLVLAIVTTLQFISYLYALIEINEKKPDSVKWLLLTIVAAHISSGVIAFVFWH